MINQANMPHLQDALESMIGSIQPDIARILDKSLSGGEVSVDEVWLAQDIGKAINPGAVEGQIEGGVVQGIGWALNEEYFVDNQGLMLNSSFLDYRMPISLDLPMIDTVIVEVANPGHPLGVRGVGEVCLVPPMAAVANAISHAVGVRTNRLPMNPSSLLEVLWEKERNGA